MRVQALIELLERLDPDDVVAIPCDGGVAGRAQMVIDALVLQAHEQGPGRFIKLVGLSDLDLVTGDERILDWPEPL